MFKSLIVASLFSVCLIALPSAANGESYAVWSEPEGEDANICFSSLRDNEWSNPRKITAGGTNVTPAITVDQSDTIWIVWVEFTEETRLLRYSKIEGGNEIQGRVLNSGSERSYSPSIIVDNTNTPWVAWAGDDGTDEDIYFSRWDGSEWDAPQQINQDDDYPDITPTIGLAPNGQPWISWLGFDGDRYDTYTVYWRQNHWSPEKKTEDSKLLRNMARDQSTRIPDLPARARNRLMGAVFLRKGGEIQSLSERVIPLKAHMEK